MENIFLLKIEVFILIISLGYIFYYFGEKIYLYYFKFKKIVSPKRDFLGFKSRKNKILVCNNDLEKIESNNVEESESFGNENYEKVVNTKTFNELNPNNIKCVLSEEDKLLISEILKKVKINTQKGYIEKSKSLIIEGLTIDKFNKELNLELAGIYESEKNFKNAELIYNDLLLHHENDSDIRKKLGFNLAMQNDFINSFCVYENVLKKRRNDLEVIEMLTDLSFDLKDYAKCLKYVTLFLKEKPRSVEKLFIKATCLENTGKNKDAILIYKKILDLQPYNTDARDKKKFLEENTIK